MIIDTDLNDFIEVDIGGNPDEDKWPIGITLGTTGREDKDKSQYISIPQARELRDELSRLIGDEPEAAPEPPRLRVLYRDVEPAGGHPKFRELLEEVWRDKHCRKAEGYGDSESGDLLANLRGSESVGIPAYLGAWIRSLDKDHRTNQAFKGGEPAPALWPKVRSDLLEKAAYCLLTIILFEETREDRDPEAAA